MLKLFVDKNFVDVSFFKFPAGESGVKIENDTLTCKSGVNVNITLKWESNNDLINLALIVDAVRRHYDKPVVALTCHYFPYARQDRVCNQGESHSLKVVANFVNSLEFAKVYVLDPHSDVVGALVDNVVICSVEHRVEKVLSKLGRSVLVAPDAGALKKLYKYAQFAGGVDVIRADKLRDTKNGKITGTVVFSEHLGNVNLLVVDDICDGGGTFIPLEKELRKITDGTVSLLVTHGIFTKGLDIFEGTYDNIFVLNNMFGEHKLIKEVV